MRIFIFLATLSIGLILYQFPLTFDLTKNKVNSLNTANQALLTSLEHPLTIDLYSTNPKIIREIKIVLALFEKESAFIKLNIHKNPIETFYKKRFGLKTPHQIALSYDDRFKVLDINLEAWSQNTFGHLIQQMIRLKEEWIVFIKGHGEGEAFGETHEDFSLLSDTLKNLGFNVVALNLSETPIPDNTKMLVLAHPKIQYLDREIKALSDYIDNGGNLLWLMHPESQSLLQKIHTKLGVGVQPYKIINTSSHLDNTNNSDTHKNRLNFSFVTQYPAHIITQNHHLLTVFPNAHALLANTLNLF